jgi:hypothetical protein
MGQTRDRRIEPGDLTYAPRGESWQLVLWAPEMPRARSWLTDDPVTVQDKYGAAPDAPVAVTLSTEHLPPDIEIDAVGVDELRERWYDADGAGSLLEPMPVPHLMRATDELVDAVKQEDAELVRAIIARRRGEA